MIKKKEMLLNQNFYDLRPYISIIFDSGNLLNPDAIFQFVIFGWEI
jgi:hypothetical protein